MDIASGTRKYCLEINEVATRRNTGFRENIWETTRARRYPRIVHLFAASNLKSSRKVSTEHVRIRRRKRRKNKETKQSFTKERLEKGLRKSVFKNIIQGSIVRYWICRITKQEKIKDKIKLLYLYNSYCVYRLYNVMQGNNFKIISIN